MTTTLKDLALQSLGALKNFAMAENKDSKTGIPPSPPRFPPLNARKAACTHINVTRLYGYFPCSHCGKTSDFGWVYRCTQDYNGQLPIWEGGLIPSVTEPATGTTVGDGAISSIEALTATGRVKHTDEKDSNPTVALKPWMERGIAEGHYTAEQIDLVKKQRQLVQDKIKEAEIAFQKHQSAKKRLSKEAARRHSHRNTFINGFGITIPEFPLDGEEESAQHPAVPLKVFPDCSYKSCQHCR